MNYHFVTISGHIIITQYGGYVQPEYRRFSQCQITKSTVNSIYMWVGWPIDKPLFYTSPYELYHNPFYWQVPVQPLASLGRCEKTTSFMPIATSLATNDPFRSRVGVCPQAQNVVGVLQCQRVGSMSARHSSFDQCKTDHYAALMVHSLYPLLVTGRAPSFITSIWAPPHRVGIYIPTNSNLYAVAQGASTRINCWPPFSLDTSKRLPMGWALVQHINRMFKWNSNPVRTRGEGLALINIDGNHR